jgi:Peptidase propeptide and YPEB domain
MSTDTSLRNNETALAELAIFSDSHRCVCTGGERTHGGPGWMPAQEVIEHKSGYTQVTQLEADDGRWEGEGIKNGQKMDFHADPKTGVITSEKLNHKSIGGRSVEGTFQNMSATSPTALLRHADGTPGTRRRQLFAEPCRTTGPSADALADDQAIDASHLNVICFIDDL